MKTCKETKKNWSKGKSIGTIILILSLFGGIAAAIPIEKKETLGPYDGGHKYYIHIYNVDDIAKAIVNGKPIAQTNYSKDSGWIEITADLTEGSNTIEFTEENAQGQPAYRYWTYGFELRQDDTNIIWKDSCGTVGNPSIGCMDNDITTGLVYRNIMTFMMDIDKPSLTLAFPLLNINAYNAKITSVFDHSMTKSYCSDNKVVAYNGETGSVIGSYVVSASDCNGDSIKERLYGYKKPDGSRFILNGNYAYTDTLYYDGHPGFDYPVPIGTDVLAAADGVVTYVDPQGKTIGGKYVIIDYLDGYQTLYYHLNEIFVNTEDKKNVNKNQVIAESGNSGSASTGAHLHFEVRKNGIPVDPYGWEGTPEKDPYTKAVNVKLWETVPPTPSPTLGMRVKESILQFINTLGISL